MRTDSYPGEPHSDTLRFRHLTDAADPYHGVVAPGTVTLHTIVHAEDAASARIADMGSAVDEHPPPGLPHQSPFPVACPLHGANGVVRVLLGTPRLIGDPIRACHNEKFTPPTIARSLL